MGAAVARCMGLMTQFHNIWRGSGSLATPGTERLHDASLQFRRCMMRAPENCAQSRCPLRSAGACETSTTALFTMDDAGRSCRVSTAGMNAKRSKCSIAGRRAWFATAVAVKGGQIHRRFRSGAAAKISNLDERVSTLRVIILGKSQARWTLKYFAESRDVEPARCLAPCHSVAQR